MENSQKNLLGKDFREELRKNYNWLIVSGSLLIVLSLIMAISFDNIKNSIIPFFFIIIGIIYFIHSYKFWFKKYIGLLLHISSAVIDIGIAAIFILQNNQWYSFLLVILIISFLFSGIFRIMTSLKEGLSWLGLDFFMWHHKFNFSITDNYFIKCC